MNIKYTFQCTLFNNKRVEEDFTITLESFGLVTVFDAIEKLLTHEYGWITKRMYQEDMKSTRYWDIVLKHMEIPTEKKK